jgi:hypothetical protein
LLVLALLAGTALALGTRAPAPTTGDGHPQPSKGKAEAVLLLALVGGLLPVALMGVSGSDGGMETRLWLPVLPIAACLSYAVLVRVATPRRAWMGAFVVGFLAVQSTAHLVERAVWIRNRANVWGAQLRSSLAPEGMTVAVFVSDDARWNGMADYELTARLTRSWTREERDRFWALPRMADIRYLEGTRVASDVVPPAKILSYVRGLVRKGTLSRFILVAVEPDGSIRFRAHDAAARAGS